MCTFNKLLYLNSNNRMNYHLQLLKISFLEITSLESTLYIFTLSAHVQDSCLFVCLFVNGISLRLLHYDDRERRK